ncbi:MAG: hypothetical protein ACLRSE_07755 [Alistipes finegoldii]
MPTEADSILRGYASDKLYYNLANAYFKVGPHTARRSSTTTGRCGWLPATPTSATTSSVAERLHEGQDRRRSRILPQDAGCARCVMSLELHCVERPLAGGCWRCCAGAVSASICWPEGLRCARPGFTAPSSLLLVCASPATWFAMTERRELLDRHVGRGHDRSTAVKSSPDKSSTDLFVLHEATVVTITVTELDDWRESRDRRRQEGWLECRTIETI